MHIRERFDLVILDWAGTVVDFGCQAPVIALREAFSMRGISISDAQARRDMGKAKADHVRAMLQDEEIDTKWRAIFGKQATDQQVLELMEDLGPLMSDQAARAARLIDGARATVDTLRKQGIKVASSTGYTREMMLPVLRESAAQGYVPDHMVCSGETPTGRPSPLMIYKACAELGIWPLLRVVKVDDTEAGVAEGRAAGCFTVGVTASGNGIGLSQEALRALPAADRAGRIGASGQLLLSAGADVVVETIAELVPALELAAQRHV
jgi:phosphonoacetaldehyde hydrolase